MKQIVEARNCEKEWGAASWSTMVCGIRTEISHGGTEARRRQKRKGRKPRNTRIKQMAERGPRMALTARMEDREMETVKWVRRETMAGKMPAPRGERRIVRVGMMADNSRLERNWRSCL